MLQIAAVWAGLVLAHLPYLSLPFFWDELGQFIPAALDIFRDGAWVPRTTVPNVHPPGVMAYLAGVWSVVGYSIPATRSAMLLLGAFTAVAAYHLGKRLCTGLPGRPEVAATVLLAASPLFYTQAMMAQLDLPAALFTVLALLLFLDNRMAACAAACTALVLVKETGLVVPLVFGAWLAREKRVREACWFLLPVLPLAVWLAALRNSTGELLGNSEFTQYNVFYPLHPVRLGLALLRRIQALFLADFHWMGAIAIILGMRKRLFAGRAWAVTFWLAAAHVLLVTALGGATLERYLLPVLPLLYIAMAAGWSAMARRPRLLSQAALGAGLLLGLFWNPPFEPFPHENNLAMADFVQLHARAARHVEANFPERTVATVWPLTAALRRPDFGYVGRPVKVKPIADFSEAAVSGLQASGADVLVVYSRDWNPPLNIRRLPVVISVLERFYDYRLPMDPEEVRRKLGWRREARWEQGGQWVEVLVR